MPLIEANKSIVIEETKMKRKKKKEKKNMIDNCIIVGRHHIALERQSYHS